MVPPRQLSERHNELSVLNRIRLRVGAHRHPGAPAEGSAAPEAATALPVLSVTVTQTPSLFLEVSCVNGFLLRILCCSFPRSFRVLQAGGRRPGGYALFMCGFTHAFFVLFLYRASNKLV